MARDSLEFAKTVGVSFDDPSLLQTAFVHSSYLNEAFDGDVTSDNERLEFLGDAILTYLVSELLYLEYPDLSEGELTNIRAGLVRREALARFARKLQLGEYLLLGNGEDESGGRTRAATLCATFEAVIGAIYLDQGIDAVKTFVYPLVCADLTAVKRRALGKDPKSRLQEWSQHTFATAPRYKVLLSAGPDHAKVFTIQVAINHVRCGVGRGRSKQDASQRAAAMALHLLGVDSSYYDASYAELLVEWPVSENVIEEVRNG